MVRGGGGGGGGGDLQEAHGIRDVFQSPPTVWKVTIEMDRKESEREGVGR